MKHAYISKRFQQKSLDLINTADGIITEYAADGYDLTLRQLYYQFVARDIIPNKQSEYNKLGSVINDARLAGLLDWNRIVDRTRQHQINSHWDDPAEIINSCASEYAIDSRADQDNYIEVWVEKDALVGVIEQACDPLDVGYLSCRGYVSQSAMWRAAQRFIRQENAGKETTILFHLGDHDPSGIDMTRDIQDRLAMFGSICTVNRIGLNQDQIDEYQPPPNPAKTTDSRYQSYITVHGEESWELDALDPRVITTLIKSEVEAITDNVKRDNLIIRQEAEREQLQEIADNWQS